MSRRYPQKMENIPLRSTLRNPAGDYKDAQDNAELPLPLQAPASENPAAMLDSSSSSSASTSAKPAPPVRPNCVVEQWTVSGENAIVSVDLEPLGREDDSITLLLSMERGIWDYQGSIGDVVHEKYRKFFESKSMPDAERRKNHQHIFERIKLALTGKEAERDRFLYRLEPLRREVRGHAVDLAEVGEDDQMLLHIDSLTTGASSTSEGSGGSDSRRSRWKPLATIPLTLRASLVSPSANTNDSVQDIAAPVAAASLSPGGAEQLLQLLAPTRDLSDSQAQYLSASLWLATFAGSLHRGTDNYINHIEQANQSMRAELEAVLAATNVAVAGRAWSTEDALHCFGHLLHSKAQYAERTTAALTKLRSARQTLMAQLLAAEQRLVHLRRPLDPAEVDGTYMEEQEEVQDISAVFIDHVANPRASPSKSSTSSSSTHSSKRTARTKAGVSSSKDVADDSLSSMPPPAAPSVGAGASAKGRRKAALSTAVAVSDDAQASTTSSSTATHAARARADTRMANDASSSSSSFSSSSSLSSSSLDNRVVEHSGAGGGEAVVEVFKRPRGRPRKNTLPDPPLAVPPSTPLAATATTPSLLLASTSTAAATGSAREQTEETASTGAKTASYTRRGVVTSVIPMHVQTTTITPTNPTATALTSSLSSSSSASSASPVLAENNVVTAQLIKASAKTASSTLPHVSLLPNSSSSSSTTSTSSTSTSSAVPDVSVAAPTKRGRKPAAVASKNPPKRDLLKEILQAKAAESAKNKPMVVPSAVSQSSHHRSVSQAASSTTVPVSTSTSTSAASPSPSHHQQQQQQEQEQEHQYAEEDDPDLRAAIKASLEEQRLDQGVHPHVRALRGFAALAATNQPGEQATTAADVSGTRSPSSSTSSTSSSKVSSSSSSSSSSSAAAAAAAVSSHIVTGSDESVTVQRRRSSRGLAQMQSQMQMHAGAADHSAVQVASEDRAAHASFPAAASLHMLLEADAIDSLLRSQVASTSTSTSSLAGNIASNMLESPAGVKVGRTRSQDFRWRQMQSQEQQHQQQQDWVQPNPNQQLNSTPMDAKRRHRLETPSHLLPPLPCIPSPVTPATPMPVTPMPGATGGDGSTLRRTRSRGAAAFPPPFSSTCSSASSQELDAQSSSSSSSSLPSSQSQSSSLEAEPQDFLSRIKRARAGLEPTALSTGPLNTGPVATGSGAPSSPDLVSAQRGHGKPSSTSTSTKSSSSSSLSSSSSMVRAAYVYVAPSQDSDVNDNHNEEGGEDEMLSVGF